MDMDDYTRPGRIGKVYTMPPQPWEPDDTRWYEAGDVRIGVEFRDVDPQSLLETYKDDPDHLAELEARSPAGGFADQGVSLHVCDAADGHEYLRFDAFESEPHYHYVFPGDEILNNVIEFDAAANGDMLHWAVDRLRNRLPEMLSNAGGDAFAARVDADVLAPVLDEVAAVAAAARQAQQGAGANRD